MTATVIIQHAGPAPHAGIGTGCYGVHHQPRPAVGRAPAGHQTAPNRPSPAPAFGPGHPASGGDNGYTARGSR